MKKSVFQSKIIWLYLAIVAFGIGICMCQGYTYLRDAEIFPEDKVDSNVKTSTFHQQGISFIYPSEWHLAYHPGGVRGDDEIFAYISPFPQPTPRIEVAKTTSQMETLEDVAKWGESRITETNVKKQPLTKIAINDVMALRLNYSYPINDISKREISVSQIYLLCNQEGYLFEVSSRASISDEVTKQFLEKMIASIKLDVPCELMPANNLSK